MEPLKENTNTKPENEMTANAKFFQAQSKGYATQANATKKMNSEIDFIKRSSAHSNEDINFSWVMTVNAEGRFVPMAVNPPSWTMTHLLHNGIAVVN